MSTADSRERFLAVERRVFAMASLYDHLLGVEQDGTVILQNYLESLCAGLREFYVMAERGISLAFHRTGDVAAAIDVASTLGLIVNELVANSVEHAFPQRRGGKITICIEREPGGVRGRAASRGWSSPTMASAIGRTPAMGWE